MKFFKHEEQLCLKDSALASQGSDTVQNTYRFMGTSMIYNNFIVIVHTAHMKTLPELGQAQEFNPANDRGIFIQHCKTSKQTNKQTQKPNLELSFLCHIHHMVQSTVLSNLQTEWLL